VLSAATSFNSLTVIRSKSFSFFFSSAIIIPQVL
jgi:hypothetical protein